MRTLVFEGVDAPRMEIVHVRSPQRARGTQLGLVYELRWDLDGTTLTVDAGAGPVRHHLGGADFFDLEHSAFFNSLPVLRDGLLTDGATAREYTMRFVAVPSLTATLMRQRYTPRGGRTVEYRAGDYVSDIDFDADGVVVDYHGYLRRLRP
ncbi:putative glycolipid-binding domain-containing protein [Nocardia terpenica]|uniref:Uncharacterized protein n=1 Tax=Nocardia terpenica TaxID=455432 RepID=A0A6G9Z403_9NOCA|nr:putative glycolipid-binding domain-containing protein [Nocardia terpenica]QIS20194.1 hypothetical protein F6W96_19755 [Nocardia terpenica]